MSIFDDNRTEEEQRWLYSVSIQPSQLLRLHSYCLMEVRNVCSNQPLIEKEAEIWGIPSQLSKKQNNGDIFIEDLTIQWSPTIHCIRY